MKSEVILGKNRLQLTRVFDGPRSLVFTFWKDAEKMQKWSGCKDSTRCEIQMDFRPGGTFTQKMQITGAGEFTIAGGYDEIVEPQKIAYHANIGPATIRILIEFIDLGNQTKVVVTQEGLPDEFTCKMISQGTSEAYDKLDGLLAAMPAEAVASK